MTRTQRFGTQSKYTAKAGPTSSINSNKEKKNADFNYFTLQETDYAFRIKTFALFEPEG